MERAARLSGSRFGYMVGDTALLALAVYRFALDRALAHGHVPMLPPVLVREEAMYGTGFFPTERSNIYALPEDDLYLTGTSEVALAGLHMGEILDELPLRYAALSTCFRREAGADGKDTRGMFRVHQFNKVELFVFCEPGATALDEHDRLLTIEEEIVGALGLPYRVVDVTARRPRRPREREEVRHRGLVPAPAALPRDHLDLEHDRLPGATPRHPLPARGPEGRRVRRHPERHSGDRPLRAGAPGELPRRGAGRAAPVRRARPGLWVASSPAGCRSGRTGRS